MLEVAMFSLCHPMFLNFSLKFFPQMLCISTSFQNSQAGQNSFFGRFQAFVFINTFLCEYLSENKKKHLKRTKKQCFKLLFKAG